ncbi:MAG: penicillin-insensitive murein endopeptidase [Myxococcales bacterium]|nr:penicillin-insensitive murein endopeptidase [Myxococcales bacterium]
MRDRSHIALALGTALLLALPAAYAGAVPPGAAIGATALPEAKWVKHRVIPGERISEICDRYGVRSHQLIKWNKLDPKRPRIRAGQQLRVHTRSSASDRERVRYVVQRGDSWARIAKKHDVDSGKLRKHWNRKKERGLRAGDTVVVWVEREMAASSAATAGVTTDGAAPAPSAPTPAPPRVAVPGGSLSVGSPSRGRLIGGARMPDNPALYTLRKPESSYGSTHAMTQLQDAIATFRQRSGFDRELVIGDMSRRRGGRFRPHRSHRSGRDVDIRLPLAAGIAKGTVPTQMSQVDWDAAWGLIRALINTGQVDYIFLSRSRQKALRRAATRAGTSEAELERLIQFPTRNRTAVVRHSRGHVKHLHVRFKCGSTEARCRD